MKACTVGTAFKVSVPRKDLEVKIAGHVKMTPPMGLTAWAAFQKMGDHVMVMGDIVMSSRSKPTAATWRLLM